MEYNPFKHRISQLNTHQPKVGNVLVAEPFMQDPYFKRSVVLICDNNADGTVGLILNEPLGIKLSEVLPNKMEKDFPLFLGGPVQAQQLYFIHTCESLPGCQKIKEGLFWNGDFDLMKDFIQSGKILYNDIKLFLGYSGWDKNQMKTEIKEESWLITQLDNNSILTNSTNKLWEKTLQAMGKEQAMLSTFPENPNLN